MRFAGIDIFDRIGNARENNFALVHRTAIGPPLTHLRAAAAGLRRPLRAGRRFDESDVRGAPRVAIISDGVRQPVKG